MASNSIPCLLFLSLLSYSILLAKCDEDDDLLQEINRFRTTSNLTALSITNGADCLADEIADTFKNRPCTNTTTPITNATLPKFSDFPTQLNTCGLNTTNSTADGTILPVCLRLTPLTNFTSVYSTYLNSTNFSAIGIATEDNWTVVVLTNTTGGSRNSNGASSLAAANLAMFSVICCFMLVFKLE